MNSQSPPAIGPLLCHVTSDKLGSGEENATDKSWRSLVIPQVVGERVGGVGYPAPGRPPPFGLWVVGLKWNERSHRSDVLLSRLPMTFKTTILIIVGDDDGDGDDDDDVAD